MLSAGSARCLLAVAGRDLCSALDRSETTRMWPPIGAVTTQVRPVPCQRGVGGVADDVSVPARNALFGMLWCNTPYGAIKRAEMGR